MLRSLRLFVWLLVVIAAAGLATLLLQETNSGKPTGPTAAASVSFGGPFTLVGADGQPFPSSRLNGKPFAIFFGFTHCPDVCPTTLARLVRHRGQLGKGDEAITIVFVTVDPERDGPQEVGTYTQQFGSRIIGLTGSPAQVEEVKKQYGIYSAKVPDGSGGYSVDHTATVLLFDRNGKFDSTIAHEEGDEPVLAKLRRLTA